MLTHRATLGEAIWRVNMAGHYNAAIFAFFRKWVFSSTSDPTQTGLVMHFLLNRELSGQVSGNCWFML